MGRPAKNRRHTVRRTGTDRRKSLHIDSRYENKDVFTPLTEETEDLLKRKREVVARGPFGSMFEDKRKIERRTKVRRKADRESK